MVYLLYSAVIATLGIGLLEGSEIAMLMVAAASRYKWRSAWRVAFAGLATLVPIIAILYFFFTIIPAYIVGTLAGIIILGLGAHFFYEGYSARKEGKGEVEDEEKKIVKAGLIGIYAAIVMEEIEAGSISMSIAVAAGGAYASAIIGMLLGLIIPLIAVKSLESIIEKIPEWMVQIAIGTVMIIAGLLILAYHV